MQRSCLSRISRNLPRSRRVAAAVVGALLAVAGFSSSADAATYTAVDSAGFTALLNNASVVRGDTIILNAGTTYTGTFTLRAKGGTSGYVTIQSSNVASLPDSGVRVSPSNAANMPNIVSPGQNGPALKTALPPEVASYYKLVGLEFYNGGTQNELSNLILLGDWSSAQNSASVIANNIIVDRCYIHGQGLVPNTLQMRRAIMLNSASTDIINCYISDILSNAGQTQNIGGSNGPGPYLIDNNFMSTSGESIIFGGGDSFVVGQNPTGIVVSRNHFYKNPAWKGVWTRPCNHFELKCGKNVIVRDNLMENCWAGPDSQMGVSINFKCVQGPPGAGSSWFVTEDVIVENNLIRDVGLGIQIAGSVNPSGGTLLGQPKNITIRNNLIYNVDAGAHSGNRGWLFYMNNASPNVTIDHNTGFSTHMWMAPGDNNQPHPNAAITNNVMMKGVYGILGGGLSDGELSLSTYYPGINWQKNVVMGSSFNAYSPAYLAGWELAPFNNGNLVVPTSWASVLVNQASPGTNFAGWKVLGWNQATNYATYPYNNSGTDGKDIGCDIDQLNTKIAGCVTGVWSAPPVTKILKNGLNGYTGATSFYVRGQAPTTYYGPSRYYNECNSLAGTHGFTLRPFYKFDVSPAASGIPAGAIIDSAKFRVKIEHKDPATGDTGASCYRMAPATGFTVNFAAATRNTYNGTTAWSGGANAAGQVADSNNDYIDTPVGTVATIPATGSWMEFTVTSAVQAWVSGTANNGLLILNNVIPSGTTSTTRLSTPADLNGSAEYPELEVTYH